MLRKCTNILPFTDATYADCTSWQDDGADSLAKKWPCSWKCSILLALLVFVSTAALFYIDAPKADFIWTLRHNYEGSKPSSLSEVIVQHSHARIRFPKTSRRLPQCIIIGVRKCGTRAALEIMNLHPQIQKASGEIHFFDRDSNYINGYEWYRKKMPFAFDDQIAVEKSPSYFTSPDVPERIKLMNASIKLILVVRDPVERLISDFTQVTEAKKKRGKYTPLTFEERVLTPSGRVDTDYKAVNISNYAMHMQRWLQVFSRDNIHIVDGDRLILDPAGEMYDIENFLCLEHRITEDNFQYNTTKGFYCLRNGTINKCLADSKGRKHPGVDPVVVSILRDYYRPFNHEFYRLVGKNFGWLQ